MKKLIATLAAAAAVFSFAPDADAGYRRSSHRGHRHYSHRHHHHNHHYGHHRHYARGYYYAPRVIVRPAYYGGYGYCAPHNGYYGGYYGYARPSINLSFGYGHYGGCGW